MNRKLRRSPSGAVALPSIVAVGRTFGPPTPLTVPGGGSFPALTVVELGTPVPAEDCALLIQAVCNWTGSPGVPEATILAISLNAAGNLRGARNVEPVVHMWEWSVLVMPGDEGIVRPMTKVILGVSTPGPTGTIINPNTWELRVFVLTGFDAFSAF